MPVKEGSFVSIVVNGVRHNGLVRKISRKGISVLYAPNDPRCSCFYDLENRGGKVKLVKESSLGNFPGGHHNIK
jgi:hypothetical protein